MEYKYEAIEHNTNIPIKIFTHTVEQFPYHWHEDTELIFVLKGSLEMRVDQDTYTLEEGDVFLINKNEIHYVKSLDIYGRTQLLALQFNMAHFDRYDMHLSMRRFRVNSIDSSEATAPLYGRIRSILAHLMSVVLNQESAYVLKVESYLLELMILLLDYFDITDVSLLERKQQSDDRLLGLLKFINDQCHDSQLNLVQIAEAFFMNPQYLSRYFKAQVGVPLKKFIDNMRMNKSLQSLQLSDDRIIDIALRYGFADAKAYYRVFREVMGVTPQEYRDLHKIERDMTLPKDYFSINSKETLSKLFDYLNPYPKENRSYQFKQESSIIQLDKTGEPFQNSGTTLMTYGYAPHGLRSDFERQLEMIQQEIGFEYVRFHGIFADEMLVYNEEEDGTVYYNFNHVDHLLDTLTAKGLKPFIEIGFMPKQLASTKRTVFLWECHVSPPRDIDAWISLVQAFVRHVINRYGAKAVRTWYFEFWNEPEMNDFFWDGSDVSFFEFFHASYTCIKAIDPLLKLGGFGNVYFNRAEKWIRSYTDYAQQHGLVLDFYSFHVYNIDFDCTLDEDRVLSELLSNRDNDRALYLKANTLGIALGSPDHMTRRIDSILEQAKSIPMSRDSYWITEWNASTDCRDLVHDTCFMAAFIVKNVLSNYNKVDGMGFWTFTDLFEEKRLKQPLFHGGFGLMTYNGIRKASYHAFAFLKQLGDVLIKRTKDYIVTRRGDDYQILLFNYCHYNLLYSRMDHSQISMTNRYDVFDQVKSVNHQLELLGINGMYVVEVQRVNRNTGSALDAWIRMGAPETLTEEGHRHLKAASSPGYQTWTIEATGQLQLEVELDPHEIQLIRIKKLYK